MACLSELQQLIRGSVEFMSFAHGTSFDAQSNVCAFATLVTIINTTTNMLIKVAKLWLPVSFVVVVDGDGGDD